MAATHPFCYPYPRPALTVDLVLFSTASPEPYVLLVKRKHPPYAGQWALPGGFVDEGETLMDAALRELAEETNLRGIDIKHVGAFADPGRDPRGWTISVAFAGFISERKIPQAGDDAEEASWWAISNLPSLAFDHQDIINAALFGFHTSLPQNLK